MEYLNFPWRTGVLYFTTLLFVFNATWIVVLLRKRRIRHAVEVAELLFVKEHLPKRLEKIVEQMACYDPQINGHLLGVEEAACLAYRNHPASDARSISHLSLIIFAACQDGKIESYDSLSFIPISKYSGLADRWRQSSLFLGDVRPDHIYQISVNVLEVMEWLNKEGFLLSGENLFDIRDSIHKEPAQSEVNDEVTNVEKPLSNRERDTLLTIIAALCKEAKLDHTKPAKTAGMIQSTAAEMGLSIGETTIEGHLKKIPNALAGRMK